MDVLPVMSSENNTLKKTIVLVFIICISVSGSIRAQKKDTLKGTVKISKSENCLSVSIAGKSEGQITVEELCTYPMVVNNAEWDVISYSVSAVIMGNLIYKENKGNFILEEGCSIIAKQKPGKKIYIENIIGQSKTGALTELGSMAFIINISGSIPAQKKDTLSGSFKISKSENCLSVSIAGKTGGQITIEELCSYPIVVNNTDWEVNSFSVSMITGGNLVVRERKGNLISEDQCSQLENLKQGNKIFLENIIAKNKSGALADVGSMSFKIEIIPNK